VGGMGVAPHPHRQDVPYPEEFPEQEEQP